MGEALNMQARLEEIASKCNRCKKCLKNCLFLQQNGTPGDIATKQLAGNTSEMLPYQCSLCGLCSRERPARIEGVAANSGNWLKKAGIFGLILAVILIARFSGISQHLDQEGLRQYVAGFGVLAPLVFVGICSIAPALMLPGLPFPVAAGVLFGPVWGTVYSILGATIGATVAFLISRYAGRDWIETKLKGTRLKELDAKVMQHGWKVVAFTRLVPVFPFNLLNYAFGLTKIGILEYVIASLVFMLPGCMAYVVFSSSLLDILKGRISWEFGAGLGLFVVVSIAVMFAKRFFNRKIV